MCVYVCVCTIRVCVCVCARVCTIRVCTIRVCVCVCVCVCTCESWQSTVPVANGNHVICVPDKQTPYKKTHRSTSKQDSYRISSQHFYRTYTITTTWTLYAVYRTVLRRHNTKLQTHTRSKHGKTRCTC